VKKIYRKLLKPDSIKIHLPEVQQKTHFSCAAAVVHSICSYWGLGLPSHYDYFPYLETDESYGTLPSKIARYLKSVGLSVDLQYNMTIRNLCQEVNKGKPVILAVQAWGNPKQYTKTVSGHYIVAIGYDEKNIYFEDPWLNCSRGFIPKNELLKRWHDMDYLGVTHSKMGIIISHKKKPVYPLTAKKIT
jgi:predicted double-glycine peptidase